MAFKILEKKKFSKDNIEYRVRFSGGVSKIKFRKHSEIVEVGSLGCVEITTKYKWIVDCSGWAWFEREHILFIESILRGLNS